MNICWLFFRNWHAILIKIVLMPICIYYPNRQSCDICKICIYDEDEIQIISNKLYLSKSNYLWSFDLIPLKSNKNRHMITIYTKEQFNLNIISVFKRLQHQMFVVILFWLILLSAKFTQIRCRSNILVN